MNEKLETLKTELENYVMINACEIPNYYDYNMKFKAANKIMNDVYYYIEQWENENNYHIEEEVTNGISKDLTELINQIVFE